jgi:hypothetical protein
MFVVIQYDCTNNYTDVGYRIKTLFLRKRPHSIVGFILKSQEITNSVVDLKTEAPILVAADVNCNYVCVN